MKLFKRIYYPIFAAVALLMLIMGFVNFSTGGTSAHPGDAYVKSAVTYAERLSETPHNSHDSIDQKNAEEYIVSLLMGSGTELRRNSSATTDSDGNNTAEFVTSAGVKQPTLYVQEATLLQRTQDIMTGDGKYSVGKTVRNIIVAIPGSDTLLGEQTSPKAALIVAPYDTSVVGIAADSSVTAAMMSTVLSVLQGGTQYKNDLVFVFADMQKDGGLGAYAFLNQFAGFDGICDRIEAAVNLSASGTKGAAMLYGATDGSSKLVSKFAGKSGGFGSSAVSSFMSLAGVTDDFGAFADVNALNYTNIGGYDKYSTALDTEISESVIKTFMGAMYEFADTLGNADLMNIDSDNNGVFFSYLNLFTVSFPAYVGYIFAGIILALLIAVIVLNRKRKAVQWGKAGAGLVVQLLTMLATLICLFASYYLIALLLSGFGVIAINSISAIVYTNPGVMIASMVLAFAFSAIFYIILKRTFAVKAADVVHGNVLLWALVGVILAFALPKIGYVFYIPAMLAVAVMLITVLLKDKFKQRFGMDIQRLFLYAIPAVLALPMFVPLMMLCGTVLPAFTLPITLTVWIALIGFIAPYFDYLKGVLDKAVKKLPPRKVRYERTVTERVEHKAKKGKFTEVTSKKIVTETVKWNYLNRVGISIIAVASVVVIFLCTLFGTAFSRSISGQVKYADSIYDDSMLFVWEKDGSSAATSKVEVYDHMAYRYISYMVNDLRWDGARGAYTKDYTGDVSKIITTEPTLTANGDTYTYNSFDLQYSTFTVTLTDASNVTSVVFHPEDDDNKEEYEFYNTEKITFRLPYRSAAFSFEITGTCGITVEQHIFNGRNLESLPGDDWDKVYDGYADEIAEAFTGGIVIRYTATKA